MRRLLLILATVLSAIGVMAQERGFVSTIKGSLKGYNYVYIVPPSDPFFTTIHTVGSPARKVNLTETAKDFYQRMGYKLVQKIDPKQEAKTLIVSYSRITRVSSSFVYTHGVSLQINDAKTQKALAIYETNGRGNSVTEEITNAFFSALDLFYFTLHPKVVVKILNETRSRVEIELTNQTPYYIDNLKLRLAYFEGDKYICEQVNSLTPRLIQGESIVTKVKRCKEGRNTNYRIKAVVVEYK